MELNRIDRSPRMYRSIQYISQDLIWYTFTPCLTVVSIEWRQRTVLQSFREKLSAVFFTTASILLLNHSISFVQLEHLLVFSNKDESSRCCYCRLDDDVEHERRENLYTHILVISWYFLGNFHKALHNIKLFLAVSSESKKTLLHIITTENACDRIEAWSQRMFFCSLSLSKNNARGDVEKRKGLFQTQKKERKTWPYYSDHDTRCIVADLESLELIC